MIVLLYTVLGIGTVLFLLWNVLLMLSTAEHTQTEAQYTYIHYRSQAEDYDKQRQAFEHSLENSEGVALFFKKMFANPRKFEKKIKNKRKSMDKLDQGNFTGINFLVLPGYVLVDKLGIDISKKRVKHIHETYTNLVGKDYAGLYTNHLLASMISVMIGSTGIAIVIGMLMFAFGNEDGLMIALVGAVFSILIAYALHQTPDSRLKKRKEALMGDFAQALTEISLLSSSGMQLFNAWEKVSRDPARQGVLYQEMRQVTRELATGFSSKQAIEGFIRRCGTEATAKFGNSILQNLTRGNDEISQFLIGLSGEVWDERKHAARQLGEKSKSRLMLPMSLIFLGILILVGVSVMIGIGGLGF